MIEEAYGFVESGRKTKEGRIGYPTREIEIGDEVIFWSEDLPGRECGVRVTDIEKYPPGTTFGDVITDDNYLALVPSASSLAEAVEVHNRYYNFQDQKKHGVLLFDFEKL